MRVSRRALGLVAHRARVPVEVVVLCHQLLTLVSAKALLQRELTAREYRNERLELAALGVVKRVPAFEPHAKAPATPLIELVDLEDPPLHRKSHQQFLAAMAGNESSMVARPTCLLTNAKGPDCPGRKLEVHEAREVETAAPRPRGERWAVPLQAAHVLLSRLHRRFGTENMLLAAAIPGPESELLLRGLPSAVLSHSGPITAVPAKERASRASSCMHSPRIRLRTLDSQAAGGLISLT